MSIKVTGTWDNTEDYTTYYAQTDDPRVLAVIVRDDDATFERCLDGDAILPTFMIDRDTPSHVGGYDEDTELAQRIVEARDRFQYAAGYRYNGLRIEHIAKADEALARWAWIFHGTTLNRGHYGYNYAYDILVLNTPGFREHIGNEELTRDEAQKWVDSMTSEIANIADGDVYGIGWATFEERVLEDGEPIDLDDWNIEAQCWGYVGEEYAKESAARWEAGAPELHTMLPID